MPEESTEESPPSALAVFARSSSAVHASISAALSARTASLTTSPCLTSWGTRTTRPFTSSRAHGRFSPAKNWSPSLKTRCATALDAPTALRSAATSAVSAHAPAGTNAAGDSAPPVPKMSFLVRPAAPLAVATGTTTAGAGAEVSASEVSVSVGGSSSSMSRGGSRAAGTTPPTGLSPVLAVSVSPAVSLAVSTWYSTPQTAATLAGSNAGASHQLALLGAASHVPQTNSIDR